MTERIELMLKSRHIEALSASDEEVGKIWEKAVATLKSSRVAALDLDAALSLAYQAALQAATAVVRAAGYRVRGGAHHQHTFEAVVALEVASLSKPARDLTAMRKKRHDAVYEWDARTEEEDVTRMRSAADRLFAEAQRWLSVQRPQIAASLPVP